MRRLAIAFALAAPVALAISVRAQIKEPNVPPGNDPGGIAVALITTGIDYRQPEIASRLARDGEGELIGLDLADGDRRPFAISPNDTPPDTGGDGTALARLLGPGTRLIPVRIVPGDPASMARAVAFIAQTPARIAVVPMWSMRQQDWTLFREAAGYFKDLLIIVAAGDSGRNLDQAPVYPASLRLGNVLSVTSPFLPGHNSTSPPNTGPSTIDALVTASRELLSPSGDLIEPPRSSREAAMLAADAIAGCHGGLLAKYRGKELKDQVLAHSRTSFPGNQPAVLERCVSRSGTSR